MRRYHGIPIKVKDNVLEDVKFKTFGCGAAIAVSSMVSELAKGETLDEAMQITNASVIDRLKGSPKKHHCSNLGAGALHRAIEDYQAKQRGKLLRNLRTAPRSVHALSVMYRTLKKPPVRLLVSVPLQNKTAIV